jgi:hypothetical protein
VSAIPPIEPILPSRSSRLVRRRTPEEDEGEPSPGHDEEFTGGEPEQSDEDDGGLPHVDIRV